MTTDARVEDGLEIAFFGSSLVSAYWNGAATYYRGIIRALARRGHRITFYEPDAYDRQAHRDIPDPEWAQVVVYSATDESGVRAALEQAVSADLVVKASGVGVFDRMLEAAVPRLRRPDGTRPLAAFWDVDAPATLERMDADARDPFRQSLPEYDAVFTYGGGDRVVEAYEALGARRCVPVYNALDPDVHHPAPPDPRFAGDLAFLANRLPDREARVEEFFLRPAAAWPARRFVLGGSGWHDKALPTNVDYVGHVYTRDHNAFNRSSLAVLNVNRDSMARFGFSPATRVFEAAGAAACIITDAFDGVGSFFVPGREILVVRDGDETAATIASLTPERARSIGDAALKRAVAAHTYAERARLVEATLAELVAEPAEDAARAAVQGRP
jgi:spore maturation protein CgeB